MPSSASASRLRFFRNTTFNVSGQILLLLVNLIATPVFFKYLGADGYGFWALALAFSGTAGGLDMGMSVGLTRAIPEFLSKKDNESLSSITAAVVFFYILFSIVVVAAAVSLAPLLALLFNTGPHGRGELREVFVFASFILSISCFAGVTSAILQGLNRFDLNSYLSTGSYLVFAVLGVIFLAAGFGITGLVLAFCIMFTLQIIFGVIIIARICPQIKPYPRLWFSRHAWSYLIKFGSRLQVSSLSDIFKTQAPKMLAGAFFGPAAAGIYDLGNRLANAGWVLPVAFLPVIVPTASEAGARGDIRRLQNLYIQGSKWLLAIALPLAACLVLFSKDFLKIWLGRGHEEIAFVLICLALANVLHLLTGVGTFIGRGIAKPGAEMKYQLLTLFLYITLVYALLKEFGFYGIPLGIAVACALGSIYFLFVFSHVIDVSVRLFIKRTILPPVGFLIPGLLLVVPAKIALQAHLTPFLIIVMMGGLFIAAYLATIGLWSVRANKGGPGRLLADVRAAVMAGKTNNI
ncbi:MAG: oligosaccharide flippase family protein [Actinobacteria bacterium]|nr:oligosaccharide flippase family protein [Actinomycetota bacterium]